MNKHFNLPPGVSINDIDPPMATCPDCKGAGSLLVSTDPDQIQECPRCDGTGEILKSNLDRGEK